MKKIWFGAMIWGMAHSTWAAWNNEEPIRTYCCDDPATSQVCADSRLPEVCRGKAYRIIDQNGNVLKRVGAHMSEEERREWEKNANQRKKDEEEAKRQARRDLALLDTYYSEKDIDVVQKRAENTLRRTIRRATERLEKAQEKLASLKKQAKKYPDKKEIPQSLQVQLTMAQNEVDEETMLIERKNAELDEVTKRYDDERARFRSLISNAEAFSKAEADKKAFEKRSQKRD